MPLVASDFIYPAGELKTGWFPDEDLSASLAVWIAQGVLETPSEATEEQEDAVVRGFTYWRAYDSKTMQMAASPDSAAIVGEISRTQVQGRKFFQAKAAEWRAVFDRAVGAASATVGTDSAPPRASQTVEFAVAF